MKDKERVAAISVLSNTTLTVSKVGVGLLTGSVSIVSEGIHSGIDLIAAIIALFAVRQSGKPADERHSFGHGKIENVSGTIEALLIFIAGVWIIIEAIHKFTSGVSVEKVEIGMIVMALSALVNFFVSNLLMKVARKTDSIALEADALHLRTDVYTSVGVFMGLALMAITGWSFFDPLIAIAVAILIIKASIDLTREAFMPLVDVSIPKQEYEVIIEVLDSYSEHFVEFHELRTRRSGSERHIDLHLVVPKFSPIIKVHQLCDHIESDIRSKIPYTNILIHAEPCGSPEEPCTTGTDHNRSCKNCSNRKTFVKLGKEQDI
ncbi:MAG: cation diffusion facilitator family transporter [Desulfitobacterium hafniense]|nr:cation diffusion facilitator family transporter [Desulfitobacterium hafniense]